MNHRIDHKCERNADMIAQVWHYHGVPFTIRGWIWTNIGAHVGTIVRGGTISVYLSLSESGFGSTLSKVGTVGSGFGPTFSKVGIIGAQIGPSGHYREWIWAKIKQSGHCRGPNWAKWALSVVHVVQGWIWGHTIERCKCMIPRYYRQNHGVKWATG